MTKSQRALFCGEGPFAVQPGCSLGQMREILGQPFFDRDDVAVVDVVAAGSANEGTWKRAAFSYQVRVDRPIEIGMVTHVGFRVLCQYRSDSEIVWAVGVHDESRRVTRTIGAIAPTAVLSDICDRLGAPAAIIPIAPILDRYVWIADRLAYNVQLYIGDHDDLTSFHHRGEQELLEVIDIQHAPEGYVEHLQTDDGAFSREEWLRRTAKKWWEFWR